MPDKFDVSAARKAGYSDDEILQHLTESRKYDVQGALKAGYSKDDIITHLSSTGPAATSAIPDAAAQAHAATIAAIPRMEQIQKADYPGADTNASPYTEHGKRVAAIGQGYSEYMKQSGELAGTVAGTMATGGMFPAIKGAPLATKALRLAGRSLATGAGAGTGALAGGATPEEAARTGAMATVSQPIAEGAAALAGKAISKFLSPKAVPVTPITEEWRKINDAIGVKANAIRIGENATDLSQAATMPGRALAKAGLTSEQLAKMSPLEQQQAIAPIRQQAASDLNRAFQEATDKGITLNAGKSAWDVINRIKGPGAIPAKEAFTKLAEEAGIAQRTGTNFFEFNATPLEARELRQALSYGARFGQGGDLGSLASIRAELYRAVNRDLHGAVPGLQDLDQFFSDTKAAGIATRNSVAKMATKAPEPEVSTAVKIGKAALKALPTAGAIAGGTYGVYRGATDLGRLLLGP